MNQDTQIAFIRAALDQFDRNTSDISGTESLSPVERYLDPARCEREISTLFHRLPVVVGAATQVTRPGDCITHELSGVPILVVRSRDGVLRAFLNVCRHRGSKLVAAGTAQCPGAIVCPYHAWTYGHDGRLVGVPHEEGFPSLDRVEHGLVRLQVAEAFGLVFVVPDPAAPTCDFDAWFGEVGADLTRFGLGSHVPYHPRKFERPINWKLMFDANLETYHVRIGHAKTIATIFGDNKGVFEIFDFHARLFLPKRRIVELRDAEPGGWNVRWAGNVVYSLFPNTVILLELDHAMVMTIWPQGPERSVVDSIALIPKEPASEKARGHWDRNMKVFWDALDEDYDLMESMQSTMRSGANKALRFGRFERCSAHFHDAVERAMA